MTPPTAHHVAFTVADLDRMVEFYTEIVGLEVATEFEITGEAFATAVDVDGASADFVHLDGDGCHIELVEYDPTGDERGEDALNQPGATHLGLQVDDVDDFFDDLPDDVTTLSEPQTTASGSRIGFIRDPEGNLIEMLDP